MVQVQVRPHLGARRSTYTSDRYGQTCQWLELRDVGRSVIANHIASSDVRAGNAL
jgi:hypothetical protein